MEMVEEGRNQPKLSSQQITIQEIWEKGEEDRISALPDCVILDILSRLPSTKDAVRTGALSKRWKYLWTSVSTLIFTYLDCCPPKSDFISFVDKTLTQCREMKLKKFKVHITYEIGFELQFNNWIRYAISRKVEQFIFRALWCDLEDMFQLDQSLYISSCFTHLTLEGCIFNPTGAISWKNLRVLCISFVRLDEDLIENILSGSPVLDTLVLIDCYGYRRLDITSKSVKKLVFCGYLSPDNVYCDDIIEINDPNILSLTIKGGGLDLWKLLLVNVSSLVEAELNYEKRGHYETTRKEAQEEMLKGFILNLLHVKELKIGVLCSKVASRLEAKGFIIPSNIKFTEVTHDWLD